MNEEIIAINKDLFICLREIVAYAKEGAISQFVIAQCEQAIAEAEKQS